MSDDPGEALRQLKVLSQLASVVEGIKTSPAARRRSAEGLSNLVFVGPCGTGKDHLLFAMLWEAVQAGIQTIWTRGADIATAVRDAMNGRSGSEASEEAVIERFARPKLLAISDIVPPADGLTPFQMASLLAIVDRRYEAGLPTWVTTNVSKPDEAKARLGEQLRERLLDHAVVLSCWWRSFRKPAAVA